MFIIILISRVKLEAYFCINKDTQESKNYILEWSLLAEQFEWPS